MPNLQPLLFDANLSSVDMHVNELLLHTNPRFSQIPCITVTKLILIHSYGQQPAKHSVHPVFASFLCSKLTYRHVQSY